MSVSFDKKGIIKTSGQECGANLFKNSDFKNGTTSWYTVNNSTINVTQKNGINVITGTKGGSNNIAGQTEQDYDYVANSLITFTISGSIYVEETGNLTVGNWITSPDVSGWQGMSGTTIWNMPQALSVGWNRFSVTKKDFKCSYRGKIVTAFSYSGTTYYLANPKFELGNIDTPWIPNVNDWGYIGSNHGFVECGDFMKIFDNRIDTTEFIEY